MGKPIIWSGVNAKLINSGDLVDKNDLSLTNGDKITVTQASHGFTSSDVGRPLYLNGSTWTLAQADTTIKSEVAGFIYAVLDANTLRVSTSGQCPSVGANFLDGGGSLTAGKLYFLSPTTAGKVTLTEPTTIGQISKPIAIATSTSAVQFFNFRGSIVGANARTQITLNNNTTANVQDMGAYDAGEITGWVYIDATTDYRFFVSIQFAKAGSGSTYNLSYTTVGDTPPAGFSFTITSAGVIQYTMPNVSGYVTALMNYALNAPAVGATFPLSVSGTSVVGGTPTVDTINEYTTNNGVQIKGRTNGSAIAVGYIGESRSGSATATAIGDQVNLFQTVISSLVAGRYLIIGHASHIISTGGTFTALNHGLGLYYGASNIMITSRLSGFASTSSLATLEIYYGALFGILDLTSTQDLKVGVTPRYSGTAPSISVSAIAIRIA